jgi:hypothetical protein
VVSGPRHADGPAALLTPVPTWPSSFWPRSIHTDNDGAPRSHGGAKDVKEVQTETNIGTRSDVDVIDGDTIDSSADVGANANASAHVDGACVKGID